MTVADRLIDHLGMQLHPEGGHYVETWRAPSGVDERSAASAIYFLLKAREASHWHRVDAHELWLWHRGDPLEIWVAAGEGDTPTCHILGGDIEAGQRPQCIVPANYWQAANPNGAGVAGYTLVSCIVAPAFDFAGFTLASPNWTPGVE